MRPFPRLEMRLACGGSLTSRHTNPLLAPPTQPLPIYLQAYIEAENKRLERDSSRCFDAREINIRMEYR